MVGLRVSSGKCCPWCWPFKFSTGLSTGWRRGGRYTHTGSLYLIHSVQFNSNIFYCFCTIESTNNGVRLQVLTTLVTALPLKHIQNVQHGYYSFQCKIRASLFQNHSKNLDLSYKMDLEFWICFGKEKSIL